MKRMSSSPTAIDMVMVSGDPDGTWMPSSAPDRWAVCAEPGCGDRATLLTGPWCPKHWCVVGDCEARTAALRPHTDGRCHEHLQTVASEIEEDLMANVAAA